MPFIDCRFSKNLSDEQKSRLNSGLLKIMDDCAGKSERFVMTDIAGGESLFMGAKKGDCTFCDVRLMGKITKEQKGSITGRITSLVTEIAEIPAERVYITFAEYDGESWGWNSKTFGG